MSVWLFFVRFFFFFFWPNISMIKPNKTADSAYIVAEDLGTAKNKYDLFSTVFLANTERQFDYG